MKFSESFKGQSESGFKKSSKFFFKNQQNHTYSLSQCSERPNLQGKILILIESTTL